MSKGGRQPRLFTIGHSDRTLEQFLRLLEHSSIRLVIDVRSNPASGRFPWFERHALARALEDRGLAYRWMRELGGRRTATPGEEYHVALASEGMRRYAAALNTTELTATCQTVIGLAASTVAVVLCAERDPDDCHRLLLADKLQLLGARVVHIIDRDEAREHSLHPDLQVEGDRLYYRARQLSLI
jgi:uncharacterized protein (DUF488 family)